MQEGLSRKGWSPSLTPGFIPHTSQTNTCTPRRECLIPHISWFDNDKREKTTLGSTPAKVSKASHVIMLCLTTFKSHSEKKT